MTVDGKLLAADAAARRDALDVSRSFIVQAPAGSGKTELLIQRYLRLLPVVDEPEEVLAITFTRKAASEMQIRVLNALRDAASGVVAEQDHRRLTLELAAAVLDRDRERTWQLVEHPRRMRMQTLDAFSAGVARSMPLTSGPGAGGTIVADAETQALYREAAAATLDWLVGHSRPRESVECVLAHLDNNTAIYIEHVARMLQTRDQWLQIVGSGVHGGLSGSREADAARKRLEQNIEVAVCARLRRIAERIPDDTARELIRLGAYAARNLGLSVDDGRRMSAFLAAGPRPGAASRDLPLWRAFAELLLAKSGGWRRRFTRKRGFPPGDNGEKQALTDIIATLSEDNGLLSALQQVRHLPHPEYSDEQWRVLLALFGLLPVAVAELRRLFGERGVTDHTEVALAAGAALGGVDEPGEITLALDYTIRHLLIDEMQDTSVGQYRLIENLLGGWEPGDGRTLFCVGDPMQSIYRFRNAEVGQFLVARRAGIGTSKLEPLLLRQNFRSGEHLVRWFNTAFGRIMPQEDDIAEGAIAYSNSVPVSRHGDAGTVEVHPIFGGESRDESKRGVDVVRRCLERSSGESVAILVRSRSQLPELLSGLRDAGIACEAIEIDRLTDLPEIIDLLALTRALCHEGDRLAWLALLRGPWVGLPWTDLHCIVRNDAPGTVPELLACGMRIEALSEPGRRQVAAFLGRIEPFRRQHAAQSLRERVELAWYALGGPHLVRDEEQLENVYRYLDVLDRIEAGGTLADPAELESRLDEERVSSVAGDKCRVQVMTMHKAKGLQFDHVVLYGLGRYARGRDKSVLSWLYLPEEHGAGDMIISPIGPRYELEHDPLHQFIEDTEKRKEERELDRLLYVACTRARRSLHLIGHVPLSDDTFRAPRSGSLLARLWPVVMHDFETAFCGAEPGTAAGEAPGPVLAAPRLRRLESWQPAAPPALPTRPGAGTEAARGEDHPVEYYWVGSHARSAGTIVHRWLQRLASGTLRLSPADIPATRDLNIALARKLGVAGAEVAAVCDRVESALRHVLLDDKGRWLLYGEGFAELPVTGRWQGRTESILIDRVRVDEQGNHWVVDYKTSTHEGGDLAQFLDQEAERYREQMEKYAALYRHLVGPSVRVRTALYFPLLRQFREVDS